MRWRWLQVYGLSALIAGVIFLSPVTTFLTDTKIQPFACAAPAEMVLKQLADPVTKPRPYAGSIFRGWHFRFNGPNPSPRKPHRKILQAATNVGAGIKAEVFPGLESVVGSPASPKLDLPSRGRGRALQQRPI